MGAVIVWIVDHWPIVRELVFEASFGLGLVLGCVLGFVFSKPGWRVLSNYFLRRRFTLCESPYAYINKKTKRQYCPMCIKNKIAVAHPLGGETSDYYISCPECSYKIKNPNHDGSPQFKIISASVSPSRDYSAY